MKVQKDQENTHAQSDQEDRCYSATQHKKEAKKDA